MNKSDRDDFRGFCQQATDAQLVNIVRNERHAAEGSEYRGTCAAIAEGEAHTRGIDVPEGTPWVCFYCDTNYVSETKPERHDACPECVSEGKG
jgi:hypothetical protein